MRVVVHVASGMALLGCQGQPEQSGATVDTTEVSSDTLGIAPPGWSGGPPVHRCANADCSETTRVQVLVRDNPRQYDLDSLPPGGLVIARFRNLGQRTEFAYGLEPGANIDHFIVVEGPVRRNTAGMRVVTQNLVTVTRGADTDVKIRRLGDLVDCGHPVDDATPVEAEFRGCARQLVPRPPEDTVEFLQSARRVNAWISCVWGCCTSEPR